MKHAKKKRQSGPSGAHKEPRIILSQGKEERGQIEHWRTFAERHDMNLSEWIRSVLDRESGRKR